MNEFLDFIKWAVTQNDRGLFLILLAAAFLYLRMVDRRQQAELKECKEDRNRLWDYVLLGKGPPPERRRSRGSG